MNNVILQDSYWWRNVPVIGGFDVGKKSNPSHCSIFAIRENEDRTQTLVMLHQKFLDNWTYTKQIEYIKDCVLYFNIKYLYYDNTRGEFEERSLPNQCVPIVLSNRTGTTAKGKYEMATNVVKLVEQRKIELLNDDRFISQITCVSNNLQSQSTASGHGDSFISVMLAVAVFTDFYATDRRSGASFIGDISSFISNQGAKPQLLKDTGACKCCGKRIFVDLPDGKKKCITCMAVF